MMKRQSIFLAFAAATAAAFTAANHLSVSDGMVIALTRTPFSITMC